MVSVASVPKTAFLSIVGRTPTEEAMLFFTILGLFIEILFYALNLFNVLTLNFCRRIPLHIIVSKKKQFCKKKNPKFNCF
jgi:hypothetical protein